MLFSRLKELSRSQTLRDITISLTGTLVASLLGFIFFVFVSRELGPSQFGIFSALIAIIVILADTTDMGVSAGLARFIGKYEALKREDKVGRFLTLSIFVKLVLATSVAIVGVIFADKITLLIFQDASLTHFFIWALFGGIVMSLFSFTTFALQSLRKFQINSSLNVTGNLIRLLLPFYFLGTVGFSIFSVLFSYILGAFIPAILGLLFLPIKLLTNIPKKEELNEFLHFNKWLGVGVLLFTLLTKLDNLLIISLNGPFEGGLYGAAQKLTFIFPLVASSLAAVWSPRFSSFKSKDSVLKYFKKTLYTVCFLASVILMIIPFSQSIVNLVFGGDYANAAISLSVLVIAWAIFIVTIPAIQYITYFSGRSSLYALIVLLQFIVVITLDLLLIPQLGALGAALAFLTGNIISFIAAYLIMGCFALWSKD